MGTIEWLLVWLVVNALFVVWRSWGLIVGHESSRSIDRVDAWASPGPTAPANIPRC